MIILALQSFLAVSTLCLSCVPSISSVFLDVYNSACVFLSVSPIPS